MASRILIKSHLLLSKLCKRGSPKLIHGNKEQMCSYPILSKVGLGVRCLPEEIEIAKDVLFRHVQGWLLGFFVGVFDRTVYWRIPIEWDVFEEKRIIEYREDGPDVDLVTDKRCVMDRSHRVVKIYFRVAVGDA